MDTSTARGVAGACALEPLLTVTDLARLLRVHPRTVTRLCARGRLPPPLKVGGGNRWRVQDIERVLRNPA